MDFIKSEMDKEFSSIGFKNQRRNLKYKEHQVGKSNKSRDESRNALLPGKRISKTGHIFYEYRKNRSDLRDSKV
jgi:hypothetical protein